MGHFSFAIMNTDNFAAFRSGINDYFPVTNIIVRFQLTFGFI